MVRQSQATGHVATAALYPLVSIVSIKLDVGFYGSACKVLLPARALEAKAAKGRPSSKIPNYQVKGAWNHRPR